MNNIMFPQKKCFKFIFNMITIPTVIQISICKAIKGKYYELSDHEIDYSFDKMNFPLKRAMAIITWDESYLKHPQIL